MGSDVGQIFPTASLHSEHLILYALVCEKRKSALPFVNETACHRGELDSK